MVFVLPTVCIVAVAALALILMGGSAPIRFDGVLRVALRLVGIAEPYQIFNRLFAGGFGWTLSVWGIGVWISLLGWAVRTLYPIPREEQTHLIASAIWIGLYAPLIFVLNYFPVYYAILVLIPMAISVSCGLSVIQRIGPSAIITGLVAKRGLQSLVWRTLLVIPSAVFLGSAVLQFWGLIGFDHTRLSRSVLALVASIAVLATVALVLKNLRRVTAFFLLFPVLCLALLVALSSVTAVQFWPGAADKMAFAVRSLVIVLVAFLATRESVLTWDQRRWRRLSVAVALLIYLGTVASTASLYATPRYTLRDTSRDLGSLLSPCASIAVLRSEGLFNNNNLSYGHLLGEADCLVVRQVLAGDHLEPIQTRNEISGVTRPLELRHGVEYRLIKTYPLWVAPTYCGPRGIEKSACEMRVNAYIRQEPGGN
jgi:hypothetical protein